jgi:2-polyprenyl-6-methoxyphenol hydroxylase-like FAD-dependent oxidoreductase
LEPLARRLSEGTLVPGSLLGVSALPFGAWARGATVNQPHTGACRLGDAFALIPPFTGNGMTMALQSAETALPSLEAYAWGRQDWASTCRQVHRALHERFRRRLRWARWLHPLLTDTRCQSMLRWGGALRGKPFHWLYHAMR